MEITPATATLQQRIRKESEMTQSDTDKCTVPQAARSLRVSLKWVRDLIYAGRLPAQKIAGRWYIQKAELEARLKQRREA